ncbi:arachidonate 5-lipoxygenase [Lewinella marina]|uniref:Uncharacterized protein n=1 Tax=Neolewinella marina TaxID=438751 RepID=A0A2G0CEA9_9BACT|nr:hypothetical protein [Neolewinella marina]NJB87386.1 arachidonate 5-lipoxygenase [Neolewinella marina]PHK98302.1 hypothetical protein CGL56_11410 [Neolewinella marina]
MNTTHQQSWTGELLADWLRRGKDFAVLWVVAKVFAFSVALFASLMLKRRMSHDNGIAARGTVRILDNPAIPLHRFFLPERTFPCRIRHATATFLDDAVKGIRSMSIKFSDDHLESPFDLQMNTGERSLFWSAASFLQFARLRKQKWGVEYRDYYRKYPDGLSGAIEALRENPESFSDLRYYCKTPFLYIGEDHTLRYAKYRVVPAKMGTRETGILQSPDPLEIPNQRVAAHNPNGRNYLKYEYRDRLEKGSVNYLIQIQLRTAAADEDPEIFNNMKPWDEEIHPWHDLAEIEITEAYDWVESCKTTFHVGNMPETLGAIPAKSIHDYNSLNYMRAHSAIAHKARLLNYRLFGYPPEIPDNDNRNWSDWEKPHRILNRSYDLPPKN